MHENEIRLIFLDNLIRGENDLYHYELAPSDVITDITFDPRMDDALYETYSSILRKFDYSGKIGKSSLYRIPSYGGLCVTLFLQPIVKLCA